MTPASAEAGAWITEDLGVDAVIAHTGYVGSHEGIGASPLDTLPSVAATIMEGRVKETVDDSKE